MRVCANRVRSRAVSGRRARDWAWRCLFSCKSYSIEHKATAQPYPKIIGRFTDDPAQLPPPSVLIARMCQTHPPHSTHPTRAPRALPGRLAAARRTTADDTGRIRQAQSPRPRPHSTLHKASPLTSVISAQHCPPPLATDRAHTKMITTHTLTNTTPRHDV